MRNQAPPTAWKAFVFLTSTLLATGVSALQMGQITLHSGLGEPLDASVALWMSADNKTQVLLFKVSSDLSYLRNQKLTDVVTRIEARLERSASGLAYVRLTTNSPVAEPIVAFRLKMYAGDAALMRNFALTLNPVVRQSRAAA